MMSDIRTSYASGANRARVDYRAGDDLPAHHELMLIEFRALQVEHPATPESVVEAHASAWAYGWLSVAELELASWRAHNW